MIYCYNVPPPPIISVGCHCAAVISQAAVTRQMNDSARCLPLKWFPATEKLSYPTNLRVCHGTVVGMPARRGVLAAAAVAVASRERTSHQLWSGQLKGTIWLPSTSTTSSSSPSPPAITDNAECHDDNRAAV